MSERDKDKEEGQHNNLEGKIIIEAIPEIKRGELIKGRVIRITPEYVVVDIGYKSEGQVPIGELKNEAGEIIVKEGDVIDVIVERIRGIDGLVNLSFKKAQEEKIWEEIARIKEGDKTIEGTIVEVTKSNSKINGFNVMLKWGIKAFLPKSQLGPTPTKDLSKLIGQSMQFKILSYNKSKKSVVVSRKEVILHLLDILKQKTLEKLKEGAILDGVVKGITNYGIFVDIGGIDGLVHISDVSWGRVKNLKQLLQIGDEVKVMVLKYDPKEEKISLGMKQVQPDPWLTVKERYPIGLKVSGKIIKIEDQGAWVELEEGVEGFVSLENMSWNKKVKKASQIVSLNKKVDCVVLDVDVKNKQVILGMKQLQPDPWEEFLKKYKVGDIIKGEIRSITDYGIFVGITDTIDGLVHKSDISWSSRIPPLNQLFKKGDIVEAIISKINNEEQKVSLSIKQLKEDPWKHAEEKYTIGSVHKVKVTKVSDFGVFVELEEGIEGLIRIGELSTEKIEDIHSFVKVGDELEAEVISCSPKNKKIALSVKAVQLRKERESLGEYEDKEHTKLTLGDIIKQKLGDQIIDKLSPKNSKKGS